MKPVYRNILRILLPIVVLALGFLMTRQLIDMRKKPQREAPSEQITPVDTVTVYADMHATVIEAAGTVMPSRQVDLRPQVNGQIVEMNSELQPGGFFKEGDVLLRIDPRDYQLALDRQKAALEQARFEVTQEKGRGAIAAREWELLGKDMQTSEEGRALALREPHLARVVAAFESAQSAVARAELDLERTVIRAPFNALVVRENVDLGQLLTSQNGIATLTGTDTYWVRASLPVGDLVLFNIPGESAEAGAEATVLYETGDQPITRTGRVVRLLGDVEQSGRMARVLIEVQDPLSLKDPSAMPLLQDAFVQVRIQGKPMTGVTAIPARALREGNRVWVVTQDQRLDIRTVTIARRQEDTVLIRNGLNSGDQVITSRISAPVPGMKLRVIEDETPDAGSTTTGSLEASRE